MRIDFIHIPKTGGTTIHHLITEKLNPESVYTFRGISPHCITLETYNIVEALEKLPAINHKIVSGHFPYWFFQKKDPDIKTSFFLTVLREPIDRILSHYEFFKKHGWNMASPLDVPANYMCRFFCSDPSLQGEELLLDSIENLKRMDFIVFFENFDKDVKRLLKKLNLNVSQELPKMRVYQKEQIFDEEILQQLHELNSLDIRLYEYARKRLVSSS